MPDVLIYADTFRSPEMRHEVAIGIPDAFLYVEKDGARHIQIGAMEIPRLAALGLYELHPSEEFGFDDLVGSGLTLRQIREDQPTGDAKSDALVHFVRKLAQSSGTVSFEDFAAIKAAGYTDAQLVEISLAFATTVFTNVFNRINDTEIDFPAVA